MIAGKKPAAESDTIGLVIKLLRIDLVKAVKLGILKYLGMYGSNTVYAETVMDIDMCHVHLIILIYDLNLFILILSCHPLVQFLYDRHKLGHNLLKILKGPLLKRFGKYGMVGISTGL